MKKQKQIPDAELEIMQVLWIHQKNMMFSELMDSLEKRNNSWKSNTVLTLLTRLSERGLLEITKIGRLNQYHPLISEEEYLKEQTKRMVNKLFGGDAKHLVSSLLKQDYLTKEDFEELKSFWNEGKEMK